MTAEPLPARTPLTGDNAIAWAEDILTSLGAPRNNTNVGYLMGWFNREGGGGENNPMNTTLHTSGSTGSINDVGVQNYSTPSAGIAATVDTLSNYPTIIALLRDGKGIPAGNPSIESELSRWSGDGYNSIQPVNFGGISKPPKGVANFKGSINLETGEWNIQGIPSETPVHWGTNEEEYSAEIQVSVGQDGGKWRIKGEPKNAKPLD